MGSTTAGSQPGNCHICHIWQPMFDRIRPCQAACSSSPLTGIKTRPWSPTALGQASEEQIRSPLPQGSSLDPLLLLRTQRSRLDPRLPSDPPLNSGPGGMEVSLPLLTRPLCPLPGLGGEQVSPYPLQTPRCLCPHPDPQPLPGTPPLSFGSWSPPSAFLATFSSPASLYTVTSSMSFPTDTGIGT